MSFKRFEEYLQERNLLLAGIRKDLEAICEELGIPYSSVEDSFIENSEIPEDEELEEARKKFFMGLAKDCIPLRYLVGDELAEKWEKENETN